MTDPKFKPFGPLPAAAFAPKCSGSCRTPKAVTIMQPLGIEVGTCRHCEQYVRLRPDGTVRWHA